MSHPFIETLFEFLEHAKTIDFSNAPTMKFISSLRDKLVFTGFSQLDAETIVASMEVEIPVGSATDEEVERLAVMYCELVNKIHQGLVDNGFTQPMLALLNISKKFSLRLE